MVERHDHCRRCGCADPARFKSLVTWDSKGIVDVGECCLQIDLSQFISLRPPEPVHETLALRLLALGGVRR